MGVTAAGVGQVTGHGVFHIGSNHLQYDPKTNYVYSDAGEVVNATTALPVGNYAAPRGSPSGYSGVVLTAVDPGLGRVFFVSTVQPQIGPADFLVEVFDQTKFTKIGTLIIPNAVGTPQYMVRWGQSGLAFVTSTLNSASPSGGMLYNLDGAFVNPSGTMDTSAGLPT